MKMWLGGLGVLQCLLDPHEEHFPAFRFFMNFVKSKAAYPNMAANNMMLKMIVMCSLP
jgi:hypothetical protein